MGSVSGSEKTKTTIPAWMQDASKQGLKAAERLGQIGYVPYTGPDVAALTTSQLSAMKNTGDAAGAFGMATPSNPMAGMPKPQTFAGGVQGYSSIGLLDQAKQDWKARAPGQFKAYNDMFINPRTGADPRWQPTLEENKEGGGGGGGGGGDTEDPLQKQLRALQVNMSKACGISSNSDACLNAKKAYDDFKKRHKL